jgi:hypothetical protein
MRKNNHKTYINTLDVPHCHIAIGKALCNKQVGFKALVISKSFSSFLIGCVRRPTPRTDKGGSSITDNNLIIFRRPLKVSCGWFWCLFYFDRSSIYDNYKRIWSCMDIQIDGGFILSFWNGKSIQFHVILLKWKTKNSTSMTKICKLILEWHFL